ncbi:MAG: oxygen-independent coproporphyrinogen III oxidase [Bacteroidota bacterium]
MNSELIKKYNVAGPRYTSYPTVPYWTTPPTPEEWKNKVQRSFRRTNKSSGISLYIHLPYCESLCTYCGCNTRITVNHAVEEPYIKALLKEWEIYLGYFPGIPRIREIHLGGGTPTFFSPIRLRELIQGITSRGIVCDNAEFSFEAHPNNTTQEHLQALFDLGFRRLSLGIQDFDSRVQYIINRIQTFNDVEQVTRQARVIGYTSVNYDLIYGLPLQDLQTMASTIAKVKHLKPDRIAFYSYAHVPWIKPGQRKFTEKHLPPDELKRKLYELGRSLLEATGYREIGMDHFALESDSLYRAVATRRLHRNFMGYTTNPTELLIGLGVSSISDSWSAYSQNVKTVEQYLKLVNENRLPAFRGHLLSDDDLVIRKHILNIMCLGKTSWKKEKEQSQSVYEAIERLKELEADGLVAVHPFRLRVTKKGKAFIRNVCMAFDARLWENSPQTQVFSKII